MSEPREPMWAEVFEAVSNPFVDCNDAVNLLQKAHAAATARIAALEAENQRLRDALKHVDLTLQVEAAEYVPAIVDAFGIISLALSSTAGGQ